ncbi:DUF2946 family protein [Xylophilus sp.]|uniref:DUF2946 family protein n=1 Tax=Xylophilus sp. TaxID=2653893 RepID=UPI0013BA4BF0|nr:DUF2946 family protein [Xylophilus sp.]KAF1049242.1 MAG: hypothetical protein GAK38_01010 [Xylophilus sp.]
MHILRTSSLLARLVLAWFVLTLGVAAASPVLQPQSVELVCSMGGGMKVVVSEDGKAVNVGHHHTLDCPMCLGLSLPLPAAQAGGDMPQPLAHALLPVVQAHIAGIAGAPLPPRGPPALS